MTRLRHAHALVTHAIGDRIPGPDRPALRLTALAMALAFAATTLIPVPASASPARADGTPARDARAKPGPFPASARRQAPAGVPTADAQLASTPLAPATPTTSADGSPTAGTATPSPAHDRDPAVAPPPDRPQASSAAEESASSSAQAGAPRDALPDLPDSLRLEHEVAKLALRAHGIRWRSTGGCSDRTVRTCTSFEGVRWRTIKGLVRFARSSGCRVTVTGGTERGHAPGTYSHANGYKLDIAPGRCVDAAIRRHPSTGVRSDGARLYRAPDGAVFAREKDHWDITFR